MNGIIDFFLSVNKVSLIAFFGILGFLVYEILLLRKEQLKKQRPNLPQFNMQTSINPTMVQADAAKVIPPKQSQLVPKESQLSPILVIIVIVMFVCFVGATTYILLKTAPEKKQPITPKVIIQEVSSPGLKVFTTDWMEIKQGTQTAQLLRPGTMVYVGIATIPEADIDRARIKVNATTWNISDITAKYNPQKNMYYKEYTIATGESKLKIDAQLHSTVDGWLGD